MPRHSYAQLFDGWGFLTRSVDALETKEPFVEERRQELATALADSMRLRSQYNKLLGKLQATSEQLQASIAQGKAAESRLRMLLRGTYGSSSPQLIRHGIPPRRAPRRRKGEVAPGMPPAEVGEPEPES
jgi:hypothetical protein